MRNWVVRNTTKRLIIDKLLHYCNNVAREFLHLFDHIILPAIDIHVIILPYERYLHL